MMVWMGIAGFVILISFAYVIVVLANKESSNMKLLGQILAAIVALFAITVLLYHVSGGGCKMNGGGMMGGGMKGNMMEKTK